jgi:hypothetical protein
MTEKIPALVHYQTTGELQAIDYNWLHLLQTSHDALTQDRSYVILPIREEQSVKKNRARLLKEDKTSPKGLILKTDQYALERYYPYAPARFDAIELGDYCATRFNAMSPDELERMVGNVANPGSTDVGDLKQMVADIIHQGSHSVEKG